MSSFNSSAVNTFFRSFFISMAGTLSLDGPLVDADLSCKPNEKQIIGSVDVRSELLNILPRSVRIRATKSPNIRFDSR